MAKVKPALLRAARQARRIAAATFTPLVVYKNCKTVKQMVVKERRTRYERVSSRAAICDNTPGRSPLPRQARGRVGRPYGPPLRATPRSTRRGVLLPRQGFPRVTRVVGRWPRAATAVRRFAAGSGRHPALAGPPVLPNAGQKSIAVCQQNLARI